MMHVEVDWAPAYELYASLLAYTNRPVRGLSEMGEGWAACVRASLPSGFPGARVPALQPWIRACPGPRDADGFLRWLAREVPGAPWLGVLRTWNEAYFRTVAPALLDALAMEAERRRQRDLEPQAQVEDATAGIWLEPPPSLQAVVLVPQWHARPWNVADIEAGVHWILYPADVLAPGPGEPPAALMRTLQALAEPSRLRILRFLAGGARSFTDVVRHTGLAKSTVHHHMVALRAAGLVRAHASGEWIEGYSLRPGALEALGGRVAAYAREEEA